MKVSFAYLAAPVLGYLVAQICKNVINRRNIQSWKEWFRSGSMPSSHTAIVTALTSVIFFREGVSELFVIAGTFSAIVIHDAMVVRRSVGEQGVALKAILHDVHYKGPTPHVAMGHTPLEVAVGWLIGLMVGLTVAILITL